MFRKSSGSFRDLSIFCSFLILFQALVESGYGQQGLSKQGLSNQGFEASGGRQAEHTGTAPANVAPARRSAPVAPAVMSQPTAAIATPVTAAAPPTIAAPLATHPVIESFDPNFSPSGYRLHPAKSPTQVKELGVIKKPAGVIGKALRPLQLNGPDDPTDPYIVNEATALNHDPTQIFNFVRDQIGYEAYNGQLRGARGTLWSQAGNAVDRASLLVALLGASGFRTQYVQGTLTAAQAKPLILSMFANRYRYYGCLPPGTATADPANDASLLAIAENHYWVQYAPSGSNTFTNADPSFPGAQLGQVFGTPVSTSTSSPGVTYNVSFEVDAEIYTQASAAFVGNGISSTPVLNYSFTSSQIVGKPVSIGQYVSSSGAGGLSISATTNTYTPYLLIGEDPTNPNNDDTITGTQFQEILTNFPLGSTVLTGLFAHVTITDPNGVATTYDKTLYDGIGYAARMSGGSVSVTAAAGQAPALNAGDLTTFNVLPGLQDQSIVTQWGSLNDSLTAQLRTISGQLPSGSSTLTPAQTALLNQANGITNQLTANAQRVLTANFALVSGKMSDALALRNQVWWYVDSPRLIVASTFVTQNSNGTSTLRYGFDLLKDDVQVLPLPGQNMIAAPAYRTNRGISESYLEGQLFASLAASQTASPGVTIQIPVSATDILSAAAAQNIAPAVITADNAGTVNSLSISADAKARIIAAAGAGATITVPSQAVTIGGTTMTGWLEIQPDGTTTGVLENGDRGALDEYVFVLSIVNGPQGQGVQMQAFLGFIAGWVVGEIGNLIGLILYSVTLNGCPLNNLLRCYKFSTNIQQAISILENYYLGAVINQIAQKLIFNPFAYAGFFLGLSAASNTFSAGGVLAAILGDPPLPQTLLVGSPPPPLAPGSSPGVTTSLTLDPNLTYPVGNAAFQVNDAQLPTVFDALITNTGPTADTFNIGFLNPPAGFTLVGSLPSIQIPAGAQAQINVCAVPSGSLPAPGTSESFGVSATSTTTAAIASAANVSFTVPSLQAAQIAANPAVATTTAGTAVSVSLSITGIGNVATSVALTAASDPNLTVTGLSSPVSVSPGQTVTQTLTITPSAGAPLNSQLIVGITGTYGSSQTSMVQIPITIEAAQALPAGAAATAAAAAGRSDIATTLSGLGSAITALVAGCTPQTLAGVQNYTQNLLQQVSSATTFFVPAFSGAYPFNDIQSATCSTYTQGLNELVQFLTNLNALFVSPAAYPFQFAIAPVSVVAQPNSISTFKIQLQNQSQITQTYNLAVSGIPAGVGGLNTTSVTLAPGQSIPAGVASDPAVVISQMGNALQSFSFTVSATPSTLPGDTQTATGTVNLRPDVLDVEAVKATPGFINAGGSVDVQAKIANTVNQPTPVQATLQVLSAANAVIATVGPVQTTLSVADLLASIDFGMVSIPAGTPNGNYTLSVNVTDASGHSLTGGTGSGFLLVGSPVTANLTVSPATVPAGNSTLLNTLTVTPTAGPGNSLTLVGSVPTASTAVTIAFNGNTAYVCDQNEVSVVDITNKSAPTVITTALSSYITNAANIHCDIQQGDLVIFSDTSSTTIGNMPGFLVFGLSNPQSPNLLAAVPFNKRFVGDPIVYSGNTAFAYTDAVLSQFGFETNTAGDIISVDVSNITNPQILGTLSRNGDPTYGGPNAFYGQALYNSSILYGTATTLTGTNTSGGAGALDVIDISNPSNLTLSNQVTVNANGVQYMGSPLIQGNTLVALANSGGTPNPESVVVFDISDPANPVVMSTTLTGTFCCSGGGEAVLGPNQFLFAGTMSAPSMSGSAGTPMLLLVDTTNPAAPVITPISIPAAPNHLAIQGNYLYAPSASGLAIYSVPGTALNSVISGYTATVQTSNAGAVTYDPTSFNVAPTTITPGTGFDTLVWNNPPVSTLTWKSNVTGLQTGSIATVDQGGTVSFTSTLGNGSVSLGPVDVNADQIISLSPSTQTLTAGQGYYGGYPGAQYTVTLRNPTAAPVTYNLSISGITPAWLPGYPDPTFPTTATVPALGTVTLTLNLNPPLTLASATYPFEVIANATGIQGAVGGNVVLVNPTPQATGPVGPGAPVPVNSSYLAIQGTPATGSAGPGGTVLFQLQLTNVGPVADTFQLGASGNPATGHATIAYAMPTPTIAPGQTYQETLSVQIPANAPVGSFPITLFGSGNNGGFGQAQLMVNVLNTGVALSLNPGYVGLTAGTTTQLTVTNTGAASDTFNLSVSGPAAGLITLPTTSVTLGAGASQTITVTLGTPTFAILGDLSFSIAAQSASHATVNGNVTSAIAVNFAYGVTAAFQPPSQTLTNSAAVFPLMVRNTGTIEDGYTAQIMRVTGPLTASLTGVNGSPAQVIPDFQVPSQTAAQLTLNVSATGNQGGTVVVQITSISDGTVSATATATVGMSTGPVVLPPNASAVTGLTVPVNRLVVLNASASTDANTPALPLTFAWTLTSKPAGSALTSASVGFPTAAIATFRPDVAGTYVFGVAVSNGTQTANATATYTAADLPPVSVVNQPFNVATGAFAFLSGANSYDPDGQPLTFAWTLLSAPMGSAVTSGSIHNAQTPQPFFTPDVAGAYKLQLIASDAGAAGNAATVIVTAYSGTVPPNANAGSGVNVGVGQTTALSAAGSSDPNASPLALTYQWTFGSVAAGSALTNASITGATTAAPTFTPDVAGSYVLNLVVSNAHGTSQAASVTVTAFSGNIPPNANAGASQYVTPNGTVTLSSAGSADPDNGPLPLAYLWWLDALPAASAATLTHPTTAAPQFVADKSGYYVARVEATDGLASGFANTLVTSAAVCDADANGVLNATDLALVTAAVGQSAGANDPRDFDHNGTINAADVTGCMNLIGQPPPATLQVTPAAFTLSVAQGGATLTQPLQISSTGAAITFTVASNQNWLTPSATSGSTASLSSLNALLNPAGLAAGSYSGVLTFTPNSGAVQTVMATLVVTPVVVAPPPPPPATLMATPAQLQFNLAGCTSTATAQMVALSSSAGVVSFNAQANASWLSVSAASSTALTASVNAAGLAAGVYSATITITAQGTSGAQVPVTLTVGTVNPLLVSPASVTLVAPSGTSSLPSMLAIGGACGSLAFTTQVDQPWLSVTNGGVVGNATNLPQGSYTGHVTITAATAPNSPVVVPATFTVGAALPGSRLVYGAVNSASFIPGPLAPGSLVSIFGAGFTDQVYKAASLPLPVSLGGVSLTLNSIALPLLYVSPTQINAQVPYEAVAGPAQLNLSSNGIAVASLTVQVAAASPGVFMFLDGSGRAAAENQDYSVNTAQNGAKPGSYLIAFLTGAGVVSPAVADGAGAPMTPVSNVVAGVTATIGGQAATVSFAGLTPSLAGVAQANILVPQLTPGNYPLVVTVGGKVSNSVLVTVGQ